MPTGDIVDLSNVKAIQSAIFIEMDVPNYQVLRFSNYNVPYTIEGYAYTNLGSLLAVSNSSSDLRPNDESFSFSISGIPSGSVAEIMDNPVKGASVTVYRALFNPSTGAQIGTTMYKFKGVVSNYFLNEDFDNENKLSFFTINIDCTSIYSLLKSRITGRRTNPMDQKKWFPNDKSMNNVPGISGSSYQFGAPAGSTTAGVK